jgi:threonine dehydrogenase-like Zn-dependent dehydrogenase
VRDVRAGRKTHCEKRTVLGLIGRNGTFAERLSLPVANLHAIPDHVSDEAAVFTEPLAAALHVLEHVRPKDRVLGRRRREARAPRRARGENDRLRPPRRDARAARAAVPRRRRASRRSRPTTSRKPSADVVVECTGQAGGLAVAPEAVRPAGTIVMKSTYRGEAAFDFTRMVVDEVSIVGSRCGAFEPAIRALADGRIDPDSPDRGALPLEDGLAALERAAEPGVLKVLIQP